MKEEKSAIEQYPSMTATINAYLRAIASIEYKDSKWGSDYLAQFFLPSEYSNTLNNPSEWESYKISRNKNGTYGFVIARTVYFDNLFKQGLKDKIPQIVILGAGYDTRAYRFQSILNKTNVYELDIHTTQNLKKKYLNNANIKISDNVHLLSINFNKELIKDILVNAGFNINKKTLYICDGIMPYIEPRAIDELLNQISKNSPTNSILSFDFVQISSKIFDGYGVREFIDNFKSKHGGEPIRFRIRPGKLSQFLSKRGLNLIQSYTSEELEDSFLILPNGSKIGKITAFFGLAEAQVK